MGRLVWVFGATVLVGFVACGGTTEDPVDDGGGAGKATQGGVAGVAGTFADGASHFGGSHGADGTVAAAGDGGVGGGDEGCPTIACFFGANFRADMPIPLAEAFERMLRACRNDTCYDGSLSPTSNVGAVFPEVDAPDGPEVYVQDGQEIEFTWSLLSDPTEATNGDHYWLSLEDEAHGSLVLIDESVDYEVVDLGCAGSCLVADVDLRGEGASNEGGAGGADGASGTGGLEGGTGGFGGEP